ncbi:MAG: hypothetical protein NC253_01435 [Ruminococcus sp.]|nr:hypothetical protein [Ruminococcus sp.]MCM1480358.1 hypothetical protein [Muribaculaceae bacterium]
MNILGFTYLALFNFFLNSLVKEYGTVIVPGDLVFSGFDSFADKIQAVDMIYNIFAWVNIFIDVDFCLNLFLLTGMFYGLKISYSLAKRLISLFKR